QRGARRVALDRLRHVRNAHDRLATAADREALHDFRVALRRLRSWIRAFRPDLSNTVSGKLERRLRRIADATGESRDHEVHIAWVRREQRSLSVSARVGATTLLSRLRASKADADLALHRELDESFDKTVEKLADALQRYEARVDDDAPRFGREAAALIERHATALDEAIHRIGGQADRAEAHAARIAAKRLRYLLEAFDALVPGIAPIIDDLKTLQDLLGELHDAQIFAESISTMVTEFTAERMAHAVGGEGGVPSVRRLRRDPVPGLRVLLRRLRKAEQSSFGEFTRTWDAAATGSLIERVVAVAGAL